MQVLKEDLNILQYGLEKKVNFCKPHSYGRYFKKYISYAKKILPFAFTNYQESIFFSQNCKM